MSDDHTACDVYPMCQEPVYADVRYWSPQLGTRYMTLCKVHTEELGEKSRSLVMLNQASVTFMPVGTFDAERKKVLENAKAKDEKASEDVPTVVCSTD